MPEHDPSHTETPDIFHCDVPTAFRLPPLGQEADLDRYPISAPLPGYPATLPPRPRLILMPQRLAAIRRDIAEGFLRPLWPALWQNHLQHYTQLPQDVKEVAREHGYILAWRAMRWVVSREKPVLHDLLLWLNAMTSVPISGHLESLVQTDVLGAIAIALDWAHDDIPADLAGQTRRWLAVQAAQTARAAESGAVWWADTWLQNHTIVNFCGIGLAAMALVDAPEEPLRRAGLQLYQQAVTSFRKAVFYEPPDGSSPELCRYACFMSEAQFLFFEALRTFSGEDLYGSFARRRIDYLIHQFVPAPSADGDVLNWGDNARSSWPHPPVSLLYCLANRFNDPIAQGAADWLVSRSVGLQGNKTWLIPLMRNPSIQPAAFPPKDDAFPCSYHAEDQGLVTLRSSWSSEATMFGMLCGPFQGHRLRQLVSKDMGAAHRHPDNASLQLCVGNTYLLVDPGYEYLKSTANHNTILIDGRGQAGEGNTWLNVNNCLNREGSALGIETFEDHGTFCHVVAQVAGAYDGDLQLTSFRRRLIFLRPDLMIVHDHLESGLPHEYRWMLHSEPSHGFLEMEPGYWRLLGGPVGLDIRVLLPGPDSLNHEVRLHHITRSRFVKETRRLDLYASHAQRGVDFLILLKILRGDSRSWPKLTAAAQQTETDLHVTSEDICASWSLQTLDTPRMRNNA